MAGEYDPSSGALAHPVVVLHVPRRAGKTALTLATLLRRLIGQTASRSWYTAQSGSQAGYTFRREWVPILHAAGLTDRIRVSLRAGGESLSLGAPHYSAVTCFPPVETALHGTNVDLAVIDEAWAFDLDGGRAIEHAVLPAQLTRQGAQTWIVSAGGTEESTWLDDWLTRAEGALAAGDPAIALFDWGADPTAPDYDPRDPAVWWRSHPALGETVTLDAIATELALAADLAAFERSILNVWPRPRDAAGGAIEAATWAACADLTTPPIAHVAAFDVAADRAHAALAQAGVTPEGRVVVEVVKYAAGTGWLTEAVRAWLAAHPGGVVICDALAAGTVADRLDALGVTVTRTGATAMARACADLIDLTSGGMLAHRAQRILDECLTGAGRRPLGDGWAWSRKNSAGEISPLVAVTLAAWGARTSPVMGAPFVVVVN